MIHSSFGLLLDVVWKIPTSAYDVFLNQGQPTKEHRKFKLSNSVNFILLRDCWRLQGKKNAFSDTSVIVLSSTLILKGEMEGGTYFFALELCNNLNQEINLLRELLSCPSIAGIDRGGTTCRSM